MTDPFEGMEMPDLDFGEDDNRQIKKMDRIGAVAAKLMERLEEIIDQEHTLSASIGEVGLVVEVNITDDEGNEGALICCRSSDSRSWIQKALFEEAAQISDQGGSIVIDEEDDDER